jgi:hypothetical protein
MLYFKVFMLFLALSQICIVNIQAEHTDSKDGYTLSEIVIALDKIQEYINNHPIRRRCLCA